MKLHKKSKKRGDKILGIDMSLNGTALVQFQSGKMTDFWFFTQKKKLSQDSHAVYFKCLGPNKEQNRLDRLYFIMNWMNDLLIRNLFKCIAMEDYAYGAQGRVFSIGELGGLMKYLFFARSIPYRLYAPQPIKKFVTGSGGADKIQMVMQVMKRWKHDFTKYDEHSSDIADAFGTVKLLDTELNIRKGKIKLEDLKVSEREVFLKTTPTRSTNILARDFIRRDIEE